MSTAAQSLLSRAAVLDRYFEGLSVERGSGWQRIAELPPLFPTLVTGP